MPCWASDQILSSLRMSNETTSFVTDRNYIPTHVYDVGACVCMWMFVRVSICMYVCMCVCVCVCVCAQARKVNGRMMQAEQTAARRQSIINNLSSSYSALEEVITYIYTYIYIYIYIYIYMYIYTYIYI